MPISNFERYIADGAYRRLVSIALFSGLCFTYSGKTKTKQLLQDESPACTCSATHSSACCLHCRIFEGSMQFVLKCVIAIAQVWRQTLAPANVSRNQDHQDCSAKLTSQYIEQCIASVNLPSVILCTSSSLWIKGQQNLLSIRKKVSAKVINRHCYMLAISIIEYRVSLLVLIPSHTLEVFFPL